MAYNTTPLPSREVGQRSTNLSEAYFTRFTPAWQRPATWTAAAWRAWVFNQPVAVICREHLISSILSLDWKITPREMKYKDELDSTIKHYTKLLESGGNNPELSLDYTSFTEWIVGDLLDIPFGAGAEIGRKGDTEGGRVMWVKPLDGGSLYPTLNKDFPVVQYWNGFDAVPFPAHAIARTYMSPIPVMDRQGWGMPPPEKIYFAMALLSRGDKYYANLLLDIPTAGILDLGDMERASAEEWVESFKTFMNESETAFRIPVLYEHNNPVTWIPFGKVPNDLMFDNITTKYAAIIAAGYGVSLSDIGLNPGGGTLAGEIRGDVRSQKNGKARVKSKVKSFFDSWLPKSLQFNFVDYDSELNVAMGRARLASATSFRTFSDLKMFSPQELRSQAIQDGLVSITLPDEVPPDSEFPEPIAPAGAFGKPAAGTGLKKKIQPVTGKVGNPKPPSSGGEGELNSRSLSEDKARASLNKLIESVPAIYEYLSSVGDDNYNVTKSLLLEKGEVVDRQIDGIANLFGADGDEKLSIRGLLVSALEDILAQIDKSIVDNDVDLPYDTIVESLLSRVGKSDNKKEE
jgi:hypothetical protein